MMRVNTLFSGCLHTWAMPSIWRVCSGHVLLHTINRARDFIINNTCKCFILKYLISCILKQHMAYNIALVLSARAQQLREDLHCFSDVYGPRVLSWFDSSWLQQLMCFCAFHLIINYSFGLLLYVLRIYTWDYFMTCLQLKGGHHTLPLDFFCCCFSFCVPQKRRK